MIGSARFFPRTCLSILLAIAACTVVVASGRKDLTGGEAVRERVRRFSIGTAGTTGALFPFGVAIGETITAHVPGLAATGEATAASVENIRRLSNGELWMGISQNEIAQAAYLGTGAFSGKRAADLRSLFGTVYSYVHIFARKDGPVSTIRDLRGKAVGVGAAGSGGELTARVILEHYGLTYADVRPQFIRESEAADALKDRRIHAFFATHPLGSAVFADLAESIRVRMLPVDDESFYEANPWFDRYDIRSGVYEGVEGPVAVPASRVVMLTSVNSGLSEDDVYRILSAIWDNRDEWKDAHAAVRSEVTFEAALSGISVPLHPGAFMFFRERGVPIDPSLYPPGIAADP